ncbi:MULTISPECIES: MDR family MFS transporter [Microbacterium]|uniref:MDR family MFS transporter n=1 Tax=Microbacterium TaxID=33882 RepID=UPI0027848908|nr:MULTISPECIES: MDR family MFS transporter [Microbacterium]MDQ1082100.1 EmrB/QacA subfamily drug resistance transporter [Microbacterium sp. SORGH_AS_0344]MDQ1169133.1 EmrB/QacA subfamily drug resistance transporter [Microbacterium proteolyticum]
MTLSRTRLRVLVAALLSVSFLGALDHTVVSTSLATIAGQLGALEHMSWIMVGYTLAATVMLPVLGKLGDIVGPRLVFVVSLVTFLVASLVCGFAPDLGWLIAARVLQGLGSAGLQLMSQTIIARVTTARERPRYMAIIGAAFPIAIVVGPVVGGLITDYWSWPWVFWINIPVGVVALVLAVTAVPRLPGGAHPRFDVPGSLVFTASLLALILAVTWIGDDALRPAAIACAVGAGVGILALVAIERRAAAPILPPRILRDRTILVCLGLSLVVGAGLFSVVAYVPTYVQMAYRTSATVSGLVPIATVLGMLVSSLLTGWLVSRSGRYRLYPIAGTALAALGLVAMALLPAGIPLWVPMGVMAAVGIGTGAFTNLIFAVVQSAASRDDLGAVTATTNLVRQIGAAVGTAVVGGVIGFAVAAGLPAGMDAATLTPAAVRSMPEALQEQIALVYHDVFAPVFLGLAAVYACGVVIALLLPSGRLSDEMPAPAAPVAGRQPV